MPRPMTITEKIFAAHAGLEEVKAGDLITAKVDITLANDITTAQLQTALFNVISVEVEED